MADAWRVRGGESANAFDKLSHKLSGMVNRKAEGDKKVLEELLRELNSLDYESPCLKSSERGVLAINQCCYLIRPEEEPLVLMACDLFANLVSKQQVSMEEKTLALAVSWCLQCLKFKSSVAVLKCLQVLVKGNGKKMEEQLSTTLAELKRISKDFATEASEADDLELLLHCLKCIESLASPSEDSSGGDLPRDVASDMFEIFRDVLYAGKCEKTADQIAHGKCLVTAMKGIGNLMEVSDRVLDAHANDILGIVKGYMLYGLPGDDGYKVQRVLPCQVSVPDVFKHSSGARKPKGKYDKKSKKMTVTSIADVNESDRIPGSNDYVSYSESGSPTYRPNFGSFKTSDSDNPDDDGRSSKVRMQERKVRHCALILLGITAKKADPKVFAGYLPNFLPDGGQIPHVRTLITCLLKDPSPKCRAELVGILTMLIANSKQYFLQADGSTRSSFTTFSSTIGSIVTELHRSLALALVAENSPVVINRLLKCVSELVRCSPYRKLDSGMIARLSRHAKDFMNHRDANVRVSALSVFGCIASVEPQVPEVRDVILRPADENPSAKSWLLDTCLANIARDAPTNTALLIESLEVAGALARNFFRESVASFPEDFIRVLDVCSKSSEYLVRLYGGKLLETVFNSLQFTLTSEDESKRARMSLVSQLWETLLPGPVTRLIQSDAEPMLRCKGCDCIANVGVSVPQTSASVQNSFIFDLLPRKLQILCVTLLFGCVLDESPLVRSSAVRALAIIVLFPSLVEDPLFFLDATDAVVETARDDNATVRYQSAWLVGNLSESIARNGDKSSGFHLASNVLSRLLQTAIKLSEDIPKIRPGAVRAIGNILKTAGEDFAKDSIADGLNALVRSATTGSFMKARWNSCYALANALKNKMAYRNAELLGKIFACLANLVQNYKNFKVRMSAACALSAPPNRKSYGDHYRRVWSATLSALENSKNVCDVNEYQHRDQLVDQLCFVMAHLIEVVQVEDLVPTQDLVVHHLESVKECLERFHESVLPERGDVLLKASARIRTLMDEANLGAEHRTAINMFENLLCCAPF